MTPATEQTDHPAPGADTGSSGPDSPRPAGRPWYLRPTRILQLAGVALVLSSYGVWAYVYSGTADRPTPDLLDDPTFSQEAQPLCDAVLDELAQGPQSFDATSGAERGEQVRLATARFEEMVDELETMVTGSERDVDILTEWLADWRVLLADRYRYAEAITVDPAARYLMTDTGVGERLDRRITRFADTNAMPSCGTPQDAG